MSDVTEKIESQIKDNKVILYMKGNREMPQCGFSSRVVQILDSYDIMYETVDVLEDPEIRQGIKDYSNWPTIPQLYVNGEFIGGCDICIELFQSGELKSIVNQA
ncbi:MAG: Grx4 family monothiol glutaredoxin [Thermodesulfobacteriota bacterium]|jgi:monothiol glutaredoxin